MFEITLKTGRIFQIQAYTFAEAKKIFTREFKFTMDDVDMIVRVR